MAPDSYNRINNISFDCFCHPWQFNYSSNNNPVSRSQQTFDVKIDIKRYLYEVKRTETLTPNRIQEQEIHWQSLSFEELHKISAGLLRDVTYKWWHLENLITKKISEYAQYMMSKPEAVGLESLPMTVFITSHDYDTDEWIYDGDLDEQDLDKLCDYSWWPGSLAESYYLKRVKIVTNEIECAICLNHIPAGESAAETLQCKHNFHFGCLRPWLDNKNTCPICRHKLF